MITQLCTLSLQGVVIWILRAFVNCLFFFFLSRRKSRRVETCFAPYPFTWNRWRFSALSFLLFYVPLPPLIVRPIEFSPFFAGLALVAVKAGQSRRSYFSWFFSSLLPRAEICIRVTLFASRIWSHRVFFCVTYCISFSIQFSVAFATELQRKSCVKVFSATSQNLISVHFLCRGSILGQNRPPQQLNPWLLSNHLVKMKMNEINH
jgi:hypothetical protein